MPFDPMYAPASGCPLVYKKFSADSPVDKL